jgi:hypothetical protein
MNKAAKLPVDRMEYTVVSNDSKKKPMATAQLPIEYSIETDLKDHLAKLSGVGSVHVFSAGRVFGVWIGISEDNRTVRNAIYDVEDQISERYADVPFDFHVIPVPHGRKMEDFITDAHPIFQRSIA